VGETRNAPRVFLSENTNGKKVLGKVTVNGRILLKETGCNSVEWNRLARDGMAMNCGIA
jgi:hypothetical protein